MNSVDILSPHSYLEWTMVSSSLFQSTSQSAFSDPYCTQCISFNSKFYIAASVEPENSDAPYLGKYKIVNMLCAFSFDFAECEMLSVPVEGFALTHYHSQLVLVGGVKTDTEEPTDTLWASDGGSNWQLSLPRMGVKRVSPTAVNAGHPECLVVASGTTSLHSSSEWLNTVEVLIGEAWFTVQPILIDPQYSLMYPRFFMHNGMLIVFSQNINSLRCCCYVKSLIASCLEPRGDSKKHELWRIFEAYDYRLPFCLLSFGQQLLTVELCGIKMLCPSTHTWLMVGDLPDDRQEPFYITSLPTGELVLLGEGETRKCEVHKATLTLLPYNIDGYFSESALHRLDANLSNLFTSLMDHFKEFIDAIGVSDRIFIHGRLKEFEKGYTKESLEDILEYWFIEQDSNLKPLTWRSLLEVLKQLDLGELRQQVIDCLSNDVPSLSEQCMTVIMSSVLQQGLEPNQLHSRLPDYVPTILRNSIVHSFKACTLQLVPFPLHCCPSEDIASEEPQNKKIKLM